MVKEKVIFFGNGPLAEAALEVLGGATEVIFRARTKADLEEVKQLKREFPEAHGVLASYGVMIREDVLDLFEPEGILNVHPSLLPRYRGASPIESAILAGESEFGVSVMKLVKAMDAGPIYWQGVVPEVGLEKLGATSGDGELIFADSEMKSKIYRGLATTGARWIAENLGGAGDSGELKNSGGLPEPKAQDEAEATCTEKLDKKMGLIDSSTESAEEILRKIIAFAGFPKVKYAFFGTNCTILEARVAEQGGRAVLTIPCADGRILAVDRLQPEGRKAMDAKSFVNGYGKR